MNPVILPRKITGFIIKGVLWLYSGPCAQNITTESNILSNSIKGKYVCFYIWKPLIDPP